MELKELTEKFTSILGDIKEFSFEKLTDENCERFYEIINGDLETDYIQKIWQYYASDRDDKKQDFTPKTLGKLVAELTKNDDEKWVYDLCCGSGALTIQKWCSNKNLKFVCEELDARIIPLLIFNLKLRNITGYVLNKNALTEETFGVYKLTPGDRFSVVEPQLIFEYPKFSGGISNPPFNLKGDIASPVKLKNLNYAFIFKMLERVKGKCAFILPNGVNTSSDEKVAREYLVNNNLIRAVITNPEKMFESTGIGTTILLCDNSSEISFVSCTDANFEKEIREQRGQFGEKSHTERVYKKEVNVYSDDNIKRIINAVTEKNNIENFSKTINSQELDDFNFQAKRYLEMKFEEPKYREYLDIIKDLERVIKQQNTVKLTVNETWAREQGLLDKVEMLKQGNEALKGINKTIKELLGINIQLEMQDYIRTTKSKELKLENTNKEWISPAMITNIGQWHTMIYFLNQEQNRLLTEFKERLLSELMSGKLDVSNFDIL